MSLRRAAFGLRTAFLTALPLALILALPVQVLAQGCAMCRTALQGPDDPLAGAINASVIFLMSMPYLIVGTIGGWMYLASRRGHAAPPSTTYDLVDAEGDDT